MSENELQSTSIENYDQSVVFDDMHHDEKPAVTKDAQVEAVRAILKQAQRLRLPPPELEVSPAKGDVGEIENSNMLDEVLGALDPDAPSSAVPAPFAPVDSPDYPLTQDLYRKFKAATPAPKVMRVDTEESFGVFMSMKRKPYLEDLDDRVTALEEAHAAREADPTINPADQGTDVLGAQIEKARSRAAVCGDVIPLSLPPDSEDALSCWQDGEEIYCSMRAIGPDGKLRVVTTSTPASRHTEEAVAYAASANVDPMAIVGVLPALTQVFGGGALVTQITRAAPALFSRPEVVQGKVFVGAVTPKVDPAVAAVMALVQLCQAKNPQACAEVLSLKKTPKGLQLITAALKGIAAAKGGV